MNEGASDPSCSPLEGPGSEPLEWHFLQCFGERTPGEEIQDADIISAVEFDETGQHLATGDRGGRVVLFERLSSPQQRQGSADVRPAPRVNSFEYRYLAEFQSHEPEFDYLKSLEIEEKINRLQWVNHGGSSRLVLSTNDKTIKLWKVYDRKVSCMSNFNLEGQKSAPWSIPAGLGAAPRAGPRSSFGGGSPWKGSKAGFHTGLTEDLTLNHLRMPQITSTDSVMSSRCRKVYSNAHTYHINSISLSSDRETFLSADDLRVNLWHLDISSTSFNIVDIKPTNMEDLTEVITAAEFHPQSCHVFAYSSSKGSVRLADQRASALCEQRAKAFVMPEQTGARTFFSEIISSISDLKFSRDGRFLLSRDYMTLKLWDVRKESGPVAVHNVHEGLRSRLCDLYENDCIFDKFDCSMSGNGQRFATGSYSNTFRVMNRQPSPAPDMILEASRDPLRRRLQGPKASNRFALTRTPSQKKSANAHNANNAVTELDPANADFQSKLLHLAWHPQENVIAGAASNSLYMFIGK